MSQEIGLGRQIKKVLDISVNVSLICASVAVVAMGINYLRASKPTPTQSEPRLGKVIKLDDATPYSGKRQKLLVAIREGCRYCEESMEFYRNLSSHADSANADLFFVLSSPGAQSSAYLAKHQILNPHIIRMDLSKLDVGGTPTIILLDDQNKVSKLWVGKLPAAEEGEVMKAIGI